MGYPETIMVKSSTVIVPLDTVVRDTRPVYPQPCYWASTVEFIKNDALEWEVVSELLDALERGEGFREPVYIGAAGGAEFEVGEQTAYVGDGTHRMVAHIIHGSEFVEVVYDSDEEDDDTGEFDKAEDGKYRVLCTTVRFEGEIEDVVDDVFGVLRSFKISDEIWMNCDVMGSSDNKFEFTWNREEADDALIKKINEICIERISKYMSVKPTSVETYFDEYNDED